MVTTKTVDKKLAKYRKSNALVKKNSKGYYFPSFPRDRMVEKSMIEKFAREGINIQITHRIPTKDSEYNTQSLYFKEKTMVTTKRKVAKKATKKRVAKKAAKKRVATKRVAKKARKKVVKKAARKKSTKAPSAKQLAARAKFAAMVRAKKAAK